jgi:hypothetical protein
MGNVAGVEDYQLALATYRAACERWPGTPITLRQGRAGDRGQPPPARGVGQIVPGPIAVVDCPVCCWRAGAFSAHSADHGGRADHVGGVLLASGASGIVRVSWWLWVSFSRSVYSKLERLTLSFASLSTSNALIFWPFGPPCKKAHDCMIGASGQFD